LDADALNHTVIFTACDTLPARKLLRKLSYHRYCIIQVVDKNQKIISTLTESQVLHAVLHDSIRITLGEIAAQNNFTKKRL
jgi:CBS-domain-containing membrane protein